MINFTMKRGEELLQKQHAIRADFHRFISNYDAQNEIKKWTILMKVYIFFIVVLLINTHVVWGSIFDYIWPNKNIQFVKTEGDTLPPIPFEIAERDEKFLLEASKLLGNNLSEMDFCQQRIILMLHKSCNSLNDEQLGKLAIMLLNCQLVSEGKSKHECTDNMTLKNCVEHMTLAEENNYKIINNRAKGMCLTIRQDQFRGLAEITVNKLMSSAHQNLKMLDELKNNQNDLQAASLNSIEEITKNNLKLLEQQQDLLKISEMHRLNTEFNLREIMREKNLIRNGHIEVATFITNLKSKIENSLSEVQLQNVESKRVYNALLSDIADLHGAADRISNRLDEASSFILQQGKQTKDQFTETVSQLKQVNDIVQNLSQTIANVHNEYNQKIERLGQLFGGDPQNVLRQIAKLSIHIIYLMIGMLSLVFVNAEPINRIIFLTATVISSAGVFFELIELNLIRLTASILVLFIANKSLQKINKTDLMQYFATKSTSRAVSGRWTNLGFNNLPQASSSSSMQSQNSTAPTVNIKSVDSYVNGSQNLSARYRRSWNDTRSRTPRLSLSNTNEDDLSDRSRSTTPFPSTNTTSNRCSAMTARGSQCQLSTISSLTEFCRIHERTSIER